MGTLRKFIRSSKQEVWRQLWRGNRRETPFRAALRAQGPGHATMFGPSLGIHIQSRQGQSNPSAHPPKTTIFYTRLKAPFVHTRPLPIHDLSLRIFQRYRQVVGNAGIEVGHDEFDRISIIKGTQEKRVARVVRPSTDQRIDCRPPHIHLIVNGSESPGVLPRHRQTPTNSFSFSGIIRTWTLEVVVLFVRLRRSSTIPHLALPIR